MTEGITIKFTNTVLDTSSVISSDVIEDRIIKNESDLNLANENINYIILKKPIFHPLFIDKIKSILELICPDHCQLYIKNSCSMYRCKKKYKKIKILIKEQDISFYDDKITFSPQDVYDIFEKIDESVLKKLGFSLECHPKNLIISYIPIIQKYIRPSLNTKNLDSEDIITILYKKIYKCNENNNMHEVFENYKNIISNASPGNAKSIIQRMSGKKGVFRNNILGKRTRLCGRSVISPNIYLKVDEICIPKLLSDKLVVKNKKINKGDLVLFIRHPTLQKMSVMTLKINISKNIKTIQMNPSLCKAYNADFDGDEMNIFCLSDFYSISEGTYINSPINCIISPQNKKPIIYPSHDCITGIYILTYKNPVLEKKIFYNCFKYINIKKFEFLRKKHVLDGKLLFSSCFDCIDFSYDNINIKDGYLVNGHFEKTSIIEFINFILKKLGNEYTLNFIYRLQIVVSSFLEYYTISIGYEDCTFYSNSNIYKKRLLENFEKLITNENCLYDIVLSESKGSKTNIKQMSIEVGQQYNKNGKVEKLKFIDKTSYIKNSYLEGLTYFEYFYCCQPSREGVINTNINTPTIGYIQRQLSKYLEDLVIQYKYTTYNNYVI